MKTLTPWEAQARSIVTALLDVKNVKYKPLAAKLAELGVQETNTNLSNKIRGGGFSFAFVLQVLTALDITEAELMAAMVLARRGVPDQETPPASS